jgi:hypothetical protein
MTMLEAFAAIALATTAATVINLFMLIFGYHLSIPLQNKINSRSLP